MHLLFLARDPISGAERPSLDRTIQNSELAQLITAAFGELGGSQNLVGYGKLIPEPENPDLFVLYYYAHADAGPYRARCLYSAPGAHFERSEFEDFPHTSRDCLAAVHTFLQRLSSGLLDLVKSSTT